MEIIFESERSLNKVLQDSSFDKDNLIYNKDLRTLEIIFYRPLLEDKKNIRTFGFHFWPFWRLEVPTVKSLLHLDNISSCDIDRPLKRYTLDCVVFDHSTIEIICKESEIFLEIEENKQLNGYLKDLGPSDYIATIYPHTCLMVIIYILLSLIIGLMAGFLIRNFLLNHIV